MVSHPHPLPEIEGISFENLEPVQYQETIIPIKELLLYRYVFSFDVNPCMNIWSFITIREIIKR